MTLQLQLQWAQDGLCSVMEIEDDTFFAIRGSSTRRGKAICRMCPINEDCFRYSLDYDMEFGVWGGIEQHSRDYIKRKSNLGVYDKTVSS